MLTRFLTAAATGMVMTAFLIFVMNYLIEVSEAVESTPRPRMTLEFGRQVEEKDVVVKKPPMVMPTQVACRSYRSLVNVPKASLW